MALLLDAFNFDPDRRSPFLKKYESREEFLDECIGHSQFKLDPSPQSNENETGNVPSSIE